MLVCVCIRNAGKKNEEWRDRNGNGIGVVQKRWNGSEHLGKGKTSTTPPPNPPFILPANFYIYTYIPLYSRTHIRKNNSYTEHILSTMPKDTASSLLAHILDNTQIPHQPLLILRDEPTFPATPIFNYLLTAAVSRYVQKSKCQKIGAIWIIACPPSCSVQN